MAGLCLPGNRRIAKEELGPTLAIESNYAHGSNDPR